MAAPKRATHVMVHPKQYLRVNGTLQHVPAGTELTLAGKSAMAMEKRGRVRRIGEKKALDLSPDQEATERVEKAEKAIADITDKVIKK